MGAERGRKYGPKPHRGLGRWANIDWATPAGKQLSLPFLCVAGLILALVGIYYGGRSLHYHLVVQKVLATGIAEPPAGLVLDLQRHAADEMLLRQIVDECSKREDTVLYVDNSHKLVVSKEIDPSHCPILDIMLRGAERGVGMCTDVALYAMHAGARIIPMPKDVEAYDSYCGPQTARMFLESVYREFLSKQKDVLHIQLLNHEHLWTQDADVHAKMQVFLCKTKYCVGLMRQHIVNKEYWASVWFMAHTSSDPSVGLSGDVITGLQTTFNPIQPQRGYAIHVKGKSGLKQTRVTLDCWAKHPEWPPLVVVGKASDEELTPPSRSASNIIYFPPISPAGSADSSPQVMLIDAARLRDMQGAASIHICPSVREGFGHYLNEARAVGALVVTVDHPPMNELVRPETGLLVPTVFTKSEPGTELGPLTQLNGHVSADGLCAVVAQGLALSEQGLQQKREATRAAYRSEKAAFLHRMGQLKAFLQARRQQQRQRVQKQ